MRGEQLPLRKACPIEWCRHFVLSGNCDQSDKYNATCVRNMSKTKCGLSRHCEHNVIVQLQAHHIPFNWRTHRVSTSSSLGPSDARAIVSLVVFGADGMGETSPFVYHEHVTLGYLNGICKWIGATQVLPRVFMWKKCQPPSAQSVSVFVHSSCRNASQTRISLVTQRASVEK